MVRAAGEIFWPQKVIFLGFFCDPNRVRVGLRPMQPLSRATGACSLAVLSHFLHFLLLPPRSGGHFCVNDISLMLNPHSQERRRVRNGATRQSASCWRAAACTFPPRSGGLCYRLLSLSGRKKRIRFMLLEAVLVISDGVEAALGSAADALIQPLLLQ